MIKLQTIVRYPIKGFSAEYLDFVELRQSEVISGDRRFVFYRQKDQGFPSRWCSKQDTICLMDYPQLARLNTRFVEDKNQISIETDGKEAICYNLGDQAQVSELENYVAKYVGEDNCRLLSGSYWRAKEGGDGHYCDNESNYISIVNGQTLVELSKGVKKSLAIERFRANFYLSGLPPWQERNWVGKRIKINDCILSIEGEISRCQAVSVDLVSGKIDVYLPKFLIKNYGHDYCGVFARVERGGRVDVGVEVIEFT